MIEGLLLSFSESKLRLFFFVKSKWDNVPLLFYRIYLTPPPFCVFGFLLSCVDYRASSVGCSELQYL